MALNLVILAFKIALLVISKQLQRLFFLTILSISEINASFEFNNSVTMTLVKVLSKILILVSF